MDSTASSSTSSSNSAGSKDKIPVQDSFVTYDPLSVKHSQAVNSLVNMSVGSADETPDDEPLARTLLQKMQVTEEEEEDKESMEIQEEETEEMLLVSCISLHDWQIGEVINRLRLNGVAVGILIPKTKKAYDVTKSFTYAERISYFNLNINYPKGTFEKLLAIQKADKPEDKSEESQFKIELE